MTHKRNQLLRRIASNARSVRDAKLIEKHRREIACKAILCHAKALKQLIKIEATAARLKAALEGLGQ